MTVLITTVYGSSGGSDVTDHLEYTLPITPDDIALMKSYIDRTMPRATKPVFTPELEKAGMGDWADHAYNYGYIVDQCGELFK